MSEPDWKWYVGHDDEVYTSGPFDTREEAIACEGGNYIVEAHKDNLCLSNHFDPGRELEQIEDDLYYLQGESDEAIFDLTAEQRSDLEKRLKQTIDQWQKDHSLVFTPWCFTHTRNEEFIGNDV